MAQLITQLFTMVYFSERVVFLVIKIINGIVNLTVKWIMIAVRYEKELRKVKEKCCSCSEVNSLQWNSNGVMASLK